MIYAISEYDIDVAKHLCTSEKLGEKYKGVRIKWRHDDIQGSNQRADISPDLWRTKPRKLASGNLAELIDYKLITSYGGYDVYLIGRDQKPKLTFEYLRNKRIGLLRKADSDSGNKIPRKAFKEAGIDEQSLKIINHFTNHPQLRKALKNHEVDIIGSYWSEADQEQHPEAIELFLETKKDAEPTSWFMREELTESDIHCAIEEALIATAKKSRVDYFKNLNWNIRCTRSRDP